MAPRPCARGLGRSFTSGTLCCRTAVNSETGVATPAGGLLTGMHGRQGLAIVVMQSTFMSVHVSGAVVRDLN